MEPSLVTGPTWSLVVALGIGVLIIVAAVTTNTVTKVGLAVVLGGRRYAWRVCAGLPLVLAAAWARAALASSA
jgi:hypothetical protein